MTVPVSASTARCSFLQVRRALAPCLSCSHSPAPKTFSPVRVIGPISRGHVYHILSNPIYAGRLRHKGQIHDGLHQAIVDRDIWDRVQRQLAEQTQKRKAPSEDAHSFLAGKLFDDRGNRMGPSHAAKGGRRWRYYISRALLKGRKQDAGSVARIPAAVIEKQVLEVVKGLLASPAHLRDRGSRSNGHPIYSSSGKTSDPLAVMRKSRPESSNIEDDVRGAIERVTVGTTTLEIWLSEAAIPEGQDRMRPCHIRALR